MARDKSSFGFMWLHQLAEYILGVSMLVSAAQRDEPALLAIFGVLVVASAAIVDAPLGAFHWVGVRVHRLIDVVVVVGMIIGAVVSGDMGTRGMLLAFAALIAVVSFVVRPRSHD